MTKKYNYKTKAQRHVDFFLSKVDTAGSLYKFIESFLKFAKSNDNVRTMLQEYLNWIKEERKKLHNSQHKHHERVGGIKKTTEANLIAVLYMAYTKSVQSKGMNFYSLLQKMKKQPLIFSDALKKMEKNLVYELLIEVERRSAIDFDFRNQLKKSGKAVDHFYSRITPLLTDFNQQQNDHDHNDAPDIVYITGLEILGAAIVISFLAAGFANAVDKIDGDD